MPTTMIIKSSLLLLVATVVVDVRAFNNSVDYFGDSFASNRSGKFLFDTLFGLEALQDELISTSSTNTLKSCDCGELRDRLEISLRGSENESNFFRSSSLASAM